MIVFESSVAKIVIIVMILIMDFGHFLFLNFFSFPFKFSWSSRGTHADPSHHINVPRHTGVMLAILSCDGGETNIFCLKG
jgi:hypothetical protein